MGKREDIIHIRQVVESILCRLVTGAASTISSYNSSSNGDGTVNNNNNDSSKNETVEEELHNNCQVVWINENNTIQIIPTTTTGIPMLNWIELLPNITIVVLENDEQAILSVPFSSMIKCISIHDTMAAVRVCIPLAATSTPPTSPPSENNNSTSTSTDDKISVSGWLLYIRKQQQNQDLTVASASSSVWTCISITLSLGNADDGEGVVYTEMRSLREMVWGKCENPFIDDDDSDEVENSVDEKENTSSSKNKIQSHRLGYRIANRTCNGLEMKRVLHPTIFRLCESNTTSTTTDSISSNSNVSIVNCDTFCNNYVTNRYNNTNNSSHSIAKQSYLQENNNSNNNNNNTSSSTTTTKIPPNHYAFETYALQYDELVSGEFATSNIAMVTCKIGHPPFLYTDYLVCVKIVVLSQDDNGNDKTTINDTNTTSSINHQPSISSIGTNGVDSEIKTATGSASNAQQKTQVQQPQWMIVQKVSSRQDFPTKLLNN